jgi:predicted nucleic acid-binding protein
LIFDTDILIWFLRGNENARKAVLDNSGFSISAVTYMELVQGMKNKRELQIMKKMINSLGVKVLPITPQITNDAIELVEKFYLSGSMELADALIAATCKAYANTLFTSNDKHYKVVDGLDIQIFRPQ